VAIRLIISDDLRHIRIAGDHGLLLAQSMPLDLARLAEYDEWYCIIEGRRFESDIGVLIFLAGMMRKRVWFQRTRLLCDRTWREIVSPATRRCDPSS